MKNGYVDPEDSVSSSLTLSPPTLSPPTGVDYTPSSSPFSSPVHRKRASLGNPLAVSRLVVDSLLSKVASLQGLLNDPLLSSLAASTTVFMPAESSGEQGERERKRERERERERKQSHLSPAYTDVLQQFKLQLKGFSEEITQRSKSTLSEHDLCTLATSLVHNARQSVKGSLLPH